MTAVPLPDVPCVRVRLIYLELASNAAGNRFYLSYSGSAPTGANCTTLASDIASAWNSNMAALTGPNFALDEVDVLDIATDSGFSGKWTGTDNGTRSGVNLPVQCATNVELGIARRYRGGKPRLYFPPGTDPDLATNAAWNSTFIGEMNTGVTAFFTAITGLSVGAMGTLTHVNLSYYKGFTNITNSSGRERAVPTYRATALHDNITGYFTKAEIGSQRRRRTSTTP